MFKNLTFKKFFDFCLTALPLVIVLWIIQFHFRQFVPGERFFIGEYGFDFFTVLDLYVAFVILLFAYGTRKKLILSERQVLPKYFSYAVLFLMLGGVLEVLFQQVYQPVLNSPIEYLRSMIVFPLVYFLIFYRVSNIQLTARLKRNYYTTIFAVCVFALAQFYFNIFPGEYRDFTNRLGWPMIDFLTLKISSANWMAFFITPAIMLLIAEISHDLQGLFGEKSLFKKVFGGFNKEARDKKIVMTFLTGLNLFLCLWVIFLTKSYGAFVGILTATTVFFFRFLNWKKFIVSILVLAVSIFGLYLSQKDSLKFKILTGGVNYRYDNSVTSRQDIFYFNYRLIRENLFLGVGLNAYQSYFTLNQERILGHKLAEVLPPSHAHNFFVSFYTNLGLLGFLGMLILIFGLFIKNGIYVNNPAIFAMIAMMTHGLIDVYYWKQDIVYIFWMIILFAMLYRRKNVESV